MSSQDSANFLPNSSSQETLAYHTLQPSSTDNSNQDYATTENTYDQYLSNTDLFSFLRKVDPENYLFIHGIFQFYNFTVEDVQMMTCCQLTAIVLPKDMVYIVRFWNKLVEFKKCNATVPRNRATVDMTNVTLINILNWAVEKDMKGSVILKGSFSSNITKCLNGTNQMDLTK